MISGNGTATKYRMRLSALPQTSHCPSSGKGLNLRLLIFSLRLLQLFKRLKPQTHSLFNELRDGSVCSKPVNELFYSVNKLFMDGYASVVAHFYITQTLPVWYPYSKCPLLKDCGICKVKIALRVMRNFIKV